MTPVTIPFVDLKSQYRRYKSEIDSRIAQVIDSGAFILGPTVKELETELEKYTGAKHAIACANGTDALQLALMAIDLKPGDEVITSPFTFGATAEAIHLCGARAVFVDIDETTFNLDAQLIEKAITPKTKAIMPVSLFGQTADMSAIEKIAHAHKLMVIEDAAQSFGATYHGKRSCNLSTLSTTSFYPAKPLGCYGDGGAVFTNDSALAEKIRYLTNHGQTSQYKYEYVGMNSRLDGIQAAILLIKLKHFDKDLGARQENARRYNDRLKTTALKLPTVLPNHTSAWAQYCVRVKDRNAFKAKLAENGVPSVIYYPVSLHTQKPYLSSSKFPVTDAVCQDILALPLCADLSMENQNRVVETIQGLL